MSNLNPPRNQKRSLENVQLPPAKVVILDVAATLPPPKPWPFSELVVHTTVDASLARIPDEVELPKPFAYYSWLHAISAGLVSPAFPETRFYNSPGGWEVAEVAHGEVTTISRNGFSVSSRGYALVSGLVLGGRVNVLAMSGLKLYFPLYTTTPNSICYLHSFVKLSPELLTKDLSWLQIVVSWMGRFISPQLVTGMPAIAAAVITCVERITEAQQLQLAELLDLTTAESAISVITDFMDTNALTENVLAPVFTAIYTVLMGDKSQAEKWEIIKAGRARRYSNAVLVNIMTSLKIHGPVSASTMREYYDKNGRPFLTKKLRECTATDFVPCGPDPMAGYNALALLNKEDAQVYVFSEVNPTLFRKVDKRIVGSGTATVNRLSVLSGETLSLAALPRVEAQKVVEPEVVSSSSSGETKPHLSSYEF